MGSTAPAREPKTITKDGRIPGNFSVVPLLLAEREIPAEVRQALLEGHCYGREREPEAVGYVVEKV